MTTTNIPTTFPFTISVWDRVKNDLNISFVWYGQSVNECFENWAKQNFTFPTFICWFIWLDRNKTIFESGTPSIQKIVFLALEAVGNHRKKEKDYLPRISTFEVPEEKVIGWFDGATHQNGEQSGAGGMIKINNYKTYKWTLNCGRVTNTRVELMGVWTSLIMASRLSIPDFHVLGD